MRLTSKFKDYYDYLIGVYGIDPKVRYSRLEFYPPPNNPEKYLNNMWLPTLDSLGYPEYETKFLFVIDNLFYLYRIKPDMNNGYARFPWKIVDSEFRNKILRKQGIRHTRSWGFRNIKNVKFNFTKSNNFKELSFLIKQPVYCVNLRNEIESKIPILNDVIGFAGIYPPEKIYLDISNFFLELNNKEVVPTSTSKEKILQHGFDIKKSFRHRI